MKEHVFTLGIEEEFAIIDPETRELRSHWLRARSRRRTAHETGRTGRAQRIKNRFDGNPSVLALARSAHHRRRALPGNSQGHAITRPCEFDFWIARARRDSQSGNGHPCDESSPIFPAAHLCVVGQFAVLGWAKYRTERLSPEGVRAFSAHRHSRFIRIAVGI